ncbi:aromatic-L-amino-acid decarboxylase [Lepeophtheirus salmonis]|uniref:aromatic-L-amino-acid decarboxylase n=1 Tax=Lepeophtheirus salmonis TaxID=72036 RepID=UPI001AE83D36|nr:aromatic-L-amino-acid decarboxylase-like [Lepeophtheirus salmonis]
MEGIEFRKRGREMVDYIVDYLENIDARRVTPSIEPGYLRFLIPREPPEDPEEWDDIMDDVEKKIMIGMTHWQHPRFHAYFPAGNSYPSILSDMLTDAIACVGFSWAAAPSCTELETIMLDWLGKMMGLPKMFLSYEEGSKGGGVIQSSASECVLNCILAARTQTIQKIKAKHYDKNLEEHDILPKLMAYCSKEAHSCVEKGAMIAFVKLRILDSDEDCRLRPELLRQTIEEDIEAGYYPFFVSTTLGTTGCCAFDNLEEIGPICEEHDAWLHVDGSYAGNALICPEFRYLIKGIEHAMSFNMNPNKWMLVNADCSTMWVKDKYKLTQALVVDPLYLQHSYSETAIDYRHWGIPLSRRFRSMKIWFVIRSYGVSGLRAYIREHCRLAKCFEHRVRSDDRFLICNKVQLGLVCFRLNGVDALNQKLLSAINESGKLHMVPANVNGRFVIRFCVCASNATEDDIDYAWKTIGKIATNVITKTKMYETYEKNVQDEPKKLTPVRKDLKYKRSFFVRMVSDPKIYNPQILSESSIEQDFDKKDENQSWISWPMANLLRGDSDFSLRFRNWNAKMVLNTPLSTASSSLASSPQHIKYENEDNKVSIVEDTILEVESK